MSFSREFLGTCLGLILGVLTWIGIFILLGQVKSGNKTKD